MTYNNNAHSHTYHCLSELLSYPTDINSIQHWQKHKDKLLPSAYNTVSIFCKEANKLGLTALQETHVRAFDTDTEASPYLAWHIYGDSPNQGQALAALNELYREAGFEPDKDEMPDYLPKVLEFLAISPAWAKDVLWDGFEPALKKIDKRLEQSSPLYSPLLKLLLSTKKE